MDTNHRALAERFAKRLLALRPTSVLDVGCGGGALLERCRHAGVPALGVEPEPGALAEGVGTVLRLRADAARLPLPDAAVDWVTLRHVPHHLARLSQALAEAWRVARTGLLLAEPWFDERIESQRLGLQADRWLKRQDRRRGMFHADCLDADALLRALPATPARSSVETHTALAPFTVEELGERAAESLDGAEPPDSERAEWEGLLAGAQAGRVTLNGTLILACWKRG